MNIKLSNTIRTTEKKLSNCTFLNSGYAIIDINLKKFSIYRLKLQDKTIKNNKAHKITQQAPHH